MPNALGWVVIITAAALAVLVFFLALQQPPPTAQVRFSLFDKKILPETTTVKAGLIRFIIHNNGPRAHGFALEGPDGKVVPGFEDVEVVPDDATVFVLVRLAPGEYTVYCPLPGHTGLGRVKKGEVAKLIVR